MLAARAEGLLPAGRGIDLSEASVRDIILTYRACKQEVAHYTSDSRFAQLFEGLCILDGDLKAGVAFACSSILSL